MEKTLNQSIGAPLKVLVCGGAGYIGSHMVRLLVEQGHEVTVLDNLSTGHWEALKWGEFIQGDVTDGKMLERLFNEKRFDIVFHFSALIVVSESVAEPARYYNNNVMGALTLLEAMRNAGMDKLVFSSTAAVYGNPILDLIDETHPLNPLNPYGRTKLMIEQILADFYEAYGFNSVSFRYFNAAGAHPDGMIGESHSPETHLIPNVVDAALKDEIVKVYGDNYTTRDGTCVRDYIHVNDLCMAHLLAFPYMEANKGAHAFNLGNGLGFTVMEVIEAVEKVSGKKIPYEVVEPREGDAAILVADSGQAMSELNWEPQYPGLEDIIKTAINWQKNRRY